MIESRMSRFPEIGELYMDIIKVRGQLEWLDYALSRILTNNDDLELALCI